MPRNQQMPMHQMYQCQSRVQEYMYTCLNLPLKRCILQRGKQLEKLFQLDIQVKVHFLHTERHYLLEEVKIKIHQATVTKVSHDFYSTIEVKFQLSLLLFASPLKTLDFAFMKRIIQIMQSFLTQLRSVCVFILRQSNLLISISSSFAIFCDK